MWRHVVLFLLCCTSVYGQVNLVDFRNLQHGDQIVGVRSFFSIFIFNNSFPTSFDLMEKLKTCEISIGVQHENVKYLTAFLQFHNIHCNLFTIYPSFQTCRGEQIFEKYDALFMDTYNFTYYIRGYRDSELRKSVVNGMINTFDFTPFPLFPSTVFVESRVGSNAADIYNFTDMTCASSYISDAESIRFLTGYSNFTPEHIQLIETFTNVTLAFNYTWIEKYAPEFMIRVGNMTELTWSLNKTMSSLLPSTCSFCTTTLCIFEKSNVGDYFIIADASLTFLFFLLLFLSGAFRKPSIKRRMLLPYLTPVLSMIMFILFKGGISRLCPGVVFYFCNFVLFWWLFMYFFTVIRFIYLRNLYRIMSTSNHKKMHKFMASTTFGLFFTVILSLVVATVITSDGAYFFTTDSEGSSTIFRTAHLVVLTLGGSLLGMVSILFDMFMNRRNIKSKGLMKFLLFDDPFFVRFVITGYSLNS